ncbi:MAG: hypothetical protein LBT65_08225 [Synergistaceae bacterium]|jgi:hypothetical protein|nr:hypothetical protein [Synergistaceae bacterium]
MKKTLIIIVLSILISGALTLVQYQESLASAKEAATLAAMKTNGRAPAKTYAIPEENKEEEDEEVWDGECH